MICLQKKENEKRIRFGEPKRMRLPVSVYFSLAGEKYPVILSEDGSDFVQNACFAL